jgi:hypothetical protein
MKERPILFSAPMVRAILAGTKTQTRRVVKYDIRGPSEPMDTFDWYNFNGKWVGAHGRGYPFKMTNAALLCPYGQPGDRLWVRETHYLHGIWSVRKDDDGKRRWTFYPNQDMGVQFSEPSGFIKGRSTTVAGWYRRPSIHMPRWASRITLEVTGVRVERLQDISEADAQAEGIERLPAPVIDGGWSGPNRFTLKGMGAGACAGNVSWNEPTATDLYRRLWEEINGPGSWDTNPWVWVVSFNRRPAGAVGGPIGPQS